jgi:hypothetical protein
MGKNLIVSITFVVFGLNTSAKAADAPLRVARDNPPYYDWTGFYVGGHLGYATGYSKWLTTEEGAGSPAMEAVRPFDWRDEFAEHSGETSVTITDM